MKKPEKKKYNPKLREREDMYKLHYNQGRQDMIDFLPSEEEILKILQMPFKDWWTSQQYKQEQAKAIAKRIGVIK